LPKGGDSRLIVDQWQVGFENLIRPGFQDMSQPLPRFNVSVLPSGAPGRASDVHVDQAAEMWLPHQLPRQHLRDRNTGGNGRPVFNAYHGAVADRMNRSIRLMVVAPNSAMRHQMIDYLESHHMPATSAATRQDALRQLVAAKPDLMVLDTRLCEADGLDLVRDIRLASDVPMIIVGRHQPDEADRVVALELGADDYITDPIGLRELVARIRAVLRRSEAHCRTPSGQPRRGRCGFGGWQLDRGTQRLTSPAGVPVALTKGEYALLAAFLDAPLRPLTRENLLQATRVHEDVFDRSIDARVLRLRRKLETDAAAPRLIRTERGTGYVFAVPVEQL
jgi:two-component system OmpR family response regulator